VVVVVVVVVMVVRFVERRSLRLLYGGTST